VTPFEERFGEAAPIGPRWDCLAVEPPPGPPYECWLGLAGDRDAAAIAWATRLPRLDRILVRAHIIARPDSSAPAHDVCDPDATWSTVLRRYVDTVGRNTRVRGITAQVANFAPAGLTDVDYPSPLTLTTFDSVGIRGGDLAHDGDQLVAEQAHRVSIVADGLKIVQPGSACAIVASALAFGAAYDAELSAVKAHRAGLAYLGAAR
jgi:hypothetical protein